MPSIYPSWCTYVLILTWKWNSVLAFLQQNQGTGERANARRHPTALGDARIPILQLALDRMQLLQTKYCVPSKVNVYVDKSSIPNAGKGLFASRTIQAGTIVSFYPAHAIGIDNEDGGDTLYLSANDSDGKPLGSAQDYSLDYIQYLVGSRPLGDTAMGTGLFVDANPNKTTDADGWLSHYINDGSTVLSNTDKGITDYYDSSRKRKNCVQIPFGPSPILTTVTTRKVKRGEELFTSYGCFYWLETILVEGEDCVDITDLALLQSKQTAQDMFEAMQLCRAKYKDQDEDLSKTFYGIS